MTIYLERSAPIQPRTSLGKSDVSWPIQARSFAGLPPCCAGDVHAELARPRELLRPGHEGAGEDEVDGEADHRELDGRPGDPRLDGDHDNPRANLLVVLIL